MYIITQIGSPLGRGYFSGFINGTAYFQYGIDRLIKTYLRRSNAEKQLRRIIATPPPPGFDTSERIEKMTPDEYAALVRDREGHLAK